MISWLNSLFPLPLLALYSQEESLAPVINFKSSIKEIFPANYNYIVPTNDHLTLYQKINNILKLNNFEKEFVKDTCYESLLVKFSTEKANKERRWTE